MKLSEGLKHFFNERKSLSKGFDKLEIIKTFKLLIGPMNKYVQDVRIDQDKLYVTITRPVLKTELSYAKEKIIQKINEQMNKTVVTKIFIMCLYQINFEK